MVSDPVAARWRDWLAEEWAVQPAKGEDGSDRWRIVKVNHLRDLGAPCLGGQDYTDEDVARHTARTHNYWLQAYMMARRGEQPNDILSAATTDGRALEP